MAVNKKDLKALGGLVIYGSIGCLLAGATGGAPPLLAGAWGLIGGVANSIVGNLAANHAAVLGNRSYDGLAQRLTKNDPRIVNHDLERLFRQSAVMALEFIKTLFLAEITGDERLDQLTAKERKEYMAGLKKFFDESIDDLRIVTKDNTETLDKETIKAPAAYLDNIVAQIFRMSSVTFDEETMERIRAFYAAQLPYCFELAFIEALKKDKQGFKAFQIWVLEEMRDNQVALAAGQQRIEDLIKGIGDGQNVISRAELETTLNGQAERIYALLEPHLVGIKQSLLAISAQIDAQFDKLYRISEATYEKVAEMHATTKDTNTKVGALHEAVMRKIGSKKYPHHLTGSLPFVPEVFIGRDLEPEAIRKRLFEDNNLLLLVNGQGGMGKTSLAATYYHKYHDQYVCAAWVLNEQGIGNALLLLAPGLGLQFEESMGTDERVDIVVAAMAELDRPCLLVIDNANDIHDLEAYYLVLRTCSNFHLLLTTRVTKLQNAKIYEVTGLPEDAALQLFREYYSRHDAAEDGLFKQIWLATGENTLLTELIAKSLQQQNENEVRYGLGDLLNDLQRKGLLAIATGEVATTYQGKLRHAKPEQIIGAMYDLGSLGEGEVAMLSVFAVLPAEHIPYATLKRILTRLEVSEMEQALKMLYEKGWLNKSTATGNVQYKISPVIQEITRRKNAGLAESVRPLISALIDLLDYETGTGHLVNCTFAVAVTYVRYAEGVFRCLEGVADFNIGILAERVGSYYTTTGNLPLALEYYEKYVGLRQELYDAHPENVSFKNGLAISYEKLGNTHSALGNLPQALEYYEKYTRLTHELYEAHPENVSFKNMLAISYSKMGNTHTALGNLPLALEYYEKDTQLSKELHEAHPENVSFKNGLAISYEKMGDTHSALGNLTLALEYYEKRTRLGTELYEAHPENVSFKNGLAISYSKMGDTHTALGDLPLALEYYEKDTQLSKELHEAHPENVSFKNVLAISYSRLGNMHTALGNLPLALEYYEKFAQLMTELREAHPENVSFKNGLAISYSKMGETHTDLGDLPLALDYYEKVTTLFEELHKAHPENVSYKNGLAISYEKMGETHTALGNLPLALEYYEKETTLFEELHKAYPENVSFKNGLAISYSKMGKWYEGQNGEKALGYFAMARDMWEELHGRFPEYVEFTKNLAWVRRELGKLSGEEGEGE